jgi:hypothetical protein
MKNLSFLFHHEKIGPWWIITFITLLTLLPFAGCKKEPTDPKRVIFEGTILEKGTSKPIDSVAVVILESQSYTGPFTVADTVFTDKAGYFRYDGGEEYGVLVDKKIKAYATKDGYYEVDRFGYTAVGSATWNTEMSPYAWCTVHIKNVRPVDEKDVMGTAHVVNDGFSDRYFKGTKIDTMVTFRKPGNEWWPLYYSYIKGGVVSPVFLDSIYMIGHDTITAKIFY